MNISAIQWISAVIFALSVLHTFFVKRIHQLASSFAVPFRARTVLLMFAELELVFSWWAVLLLALFSMIQGPQASLDYLRSQSFTEPLFVLVILAVCSTRPILHVAEFVIHKISGWISGVSLLKDNVAFYLCLMIIGPILGSFITEVAAMTVTALLLHKNFFRKSVSLQFKYATLGLLFVNISIGGTLTTFAAPPILMVASKWGWSMSHLFFHFGWKGILACVLSAACVSYRFRNELNLLEAERETPVSVAGWVQVIYLLFLGMLVFFGHQPAFFISIFLSFLIVARSMKNAPERIHFKNALLVALFLTGLVVIGGMQGWWLGPILTRLSDFHLYLGAIGLTAFVDNAALTYLGSLVPSLTEDARQALVSGAVVGGGLTIIANAPNPAGYSILRSAFEEGEVNPLLLLRAALVPTLIAAVCFWVF